ncbi:TetR/AcrR family transcriptional regulator [Sphingomonas hylomeconis]|uniref:TetR/AcrR family transcriptional regulator n=1 Tax=Sphingomonas hylomeconis TaxID=1395958 RepID=A0ABV7STS9_9SPHN|nr:TetR/AcrR family transcriptional regulator [Sphingomonas hylomeconis]
MTAPEPAGRAQRRHAFVDAARDAFFTRGYGTTTMSSIAATVGGSKTTLWAYFPSKEDLFAAVIDDIVERYSLALTVDIEEAEPVETVLRRFGRAMMSTILSDPIIALHRLVIGEALRFPELGKIFYERGPKRGKARLAQFIAAAMADGRLRHGDAMLATRQFSSMCQSGRMQEVLLGIEGFRDLTLSDRDVDTAVETFMRAWGAD